MSLLTVQNAKTSKGEKQGYLTGILYLVPADGFDLMRSTKADLIDLESGANVPRDILRTLCPHASAGCRAVCLFTAGRGQFQSVKDGRARKTALFFEDPVAFVDLLAVDILALERKAKREGLIPVVRLNGTSDVPWERMKGSDGRTLMARFPHIQFYDYTKRPNRETGHANYHLTFSRSETNDVQVMAELGRGRNVAVVFDVKRGKPLPLAWRGFQVIDGDLSDLRFLDGADGAVVIGLRAKGDAKVDDSGFVQIAA